MASPYVTTKPVADINATINVNELKYSNILLNNEDKYIDKRPYMNYSSVIQEIVDSKKTIIDSKSPEALSWKTPGSMNGKIGQWELVINPSDNIIYHFQFKGHKSFNK